jgi:hypothetical protein
MNKIFLAVTFMLEGTFYDEHDSYPVGSWLLNPRSSEHCFHIKGDDALIHFKIGHLHANENRSSNYVIKSGYQMRE